MWQRVSCLAFKERQVPDLLSPAEPQGNGKSKCFFVTCHGIVFRYHFGISWSITPHSPHIFLNTSPIRHLLPHHLRSLSSKLADNGKACPETHRILVRKTWVAPNTLSTSDDFQKIPILGATATITGKSLPCLFPEGTKFMLILPSNPKHLTPTCRSSITLV